MNQAVKCEINNIMSEILEFRYVNWEYEKHLCLKLLNLAVENSYPFAEAFAHTYLGDYFINQNDSEQCSPHLLDALMLAQERSYNDLLVYIYSLLGLYYGVISDEQNSLRYYMDGIAAAERQNDKVTESFIYCNIASSFFRHYDYKQALKYHNAAYELISDAHEKYAVNKAFVLSNIVESYLAIDQFDEAKKQIDICDNLNSKHLIITCLQLKNWCRYYSKIGNKTQALIFAENILNYTDYINKNKLFAFECYIQICSSMLKLYEHDLTLKFFELMNECYSPNSPDQVYQIENFRTTIQLCFTPAENHTEMYRRYYHKMRELRELTNQIIVDGMNAKIQLFRVIQQKEVLHKEKNELKFQVNRDELTQLYSRRYLEELIEKYEKNIVSFNLGFIMIDVDLLKEYNDFYGHLKGDEVLHTIGECMLAHCPLGLYPCRFGGDEFVCLCTGLSEGQILAYIRAVREDLHRRAIVHDASFCSRYITISVGYVNASSDDGLSPHTLWEFADKALYQSKTNGRNSCTKAELNKNIIN